MLDGFRNTSPYTRSWEWLVEIESIHGELDTQRFSKTESECRLRLNGIIQKVVFSAPQSSYVAERLRKASYEGGDEILRFDRPERIPPFSDCLECLLLAAAQWPWRDERDIWFACIILERVDERVNTYRRVGFAEIRDVDPSWRLRGRRSVIEIV
jgi:hypothetical protein